MRTPRRAWTLLLLPILGGCPTRVVYTEDGGAGGSGGSEAKGGQAGSVAGTSGSAGRGSGTGGSGGTAGAGVEPGTGGTASTDGSPGSAGGAGASGTGTGGASGGAGHAPGGTGAGGSATGDAGNGGSGTGGSGGGGSGTGGIKASGGATGGSGTAGSGAGGVPGSGGATGGTGTGGIAGHPAGGSGTGGATSCTNTESDSHNCGTCGHDCLGGSCSAGVCQPLLLGTVPVTDFADETVVLNGVVYVFSDTSDTGKRTDLWQVNADTPGTPTEVTTNGKVSCILEQQLFWTTYDTPGRIFSCALSNCAATATPIVTLAGNATFGTPLRCDPASDELVWTSTTNSNDFNINRASPSGANARVITSLNFPNDGASWGLLDSGTQATRLFYSRLQETISPSGTTGAGSLYYIATNVENAAGVGILTLQDSEIGDVLPSDGTALVSESSLSTSASQEMSVPLPNGITSGAAPVFSTGFIVNYGGVIDQTTFYGFISSNSGVPADAVIKCPLTNCTSPTILFRGQAMPSAFAEDANAIYWTTNAFTQTQGFSIWKAAK